MTTKISTHAHTAPESSLERLTSLAEGCDVVLQCPTSHVARYEEALHDDDDDDAGGSDDGIGGGVGGCGYGVGSSTKILGSYGRNAESLLFVSAPDPVRFLADVSAARYMRRVTKKAYLFRNGSGGGALVRSGRAVAPEALRRLRAARRGGGGRIGVDDDDDDEDYDDGGGRDAPSMVVRISSFPPKMAPALASEIEELMERGGGDGDDDDDDDGGGGGTMTDDDFITFRPTNPTHILSSIRLDDDIHMLSVEPAADAQRGGGEGGGWNQCVTDDVSRAYHKLEEAFDRYSGGGFGSGSARDNLAGSVALDCGASPGGWTKYLAEEVRCRAIYSVDPAELSGDVLGMDRVHHLRTRIEDAIGDLRRDGTQIGLWVSDMCLFNMSGQIDTLLEARASGLLRDGCFFVLTLKCVRGRTKASFDSQVEKEVKRLDGIVTGVEVFHLFSNRSGERTVMGFMI